MTVCHPCWKQNSQWIKLVFDKALVLTTRWLFLLTVCGKGVEWNSDIWFANLDLTNAFDRVEHTQLFPALREQHVPQPHIALLRAIDSSQSGAVHGGRPCDIQRGVKQNDILSPMFFNAALARGAKGTVVLGSHFLSLCAEPERLRCIAFI